MASYDIFFWDRLPGLDAAPMATVLPLTPRTDIVSLGTEAWGDPHMFGSFWILEDFKILLYFWKIQKLKNPKNLRS